MVGGTRELESAWDLFGGTAHADPTIRTLIADHDPISRRVLDRVLRSSASIEVVGSVDSHRPLPDWPLRQIDVAVVGLSTGDRLVGTVRDLSARQVRVLLIDVDWTRRGVEVAVAAGASGCLVKNADLSGVVSGVQAVAGGNRVLSPELLNFYVASPAASARERGALDAVSRLTDRERQVLVLLGEGVSTTEAAKKCGVSSATASSQSPLSQWTSPSRRRLTASPPRLPSRRNWSTAR
jgi:DNA-binding NarL/FixJ family response regulator